MPTYNYYCEKCDMNFSYFQQMSESSLSTCEECGGKIERIITGGTGLIFKGSGFYLTDYKDGGKKDGEKLDSDTEKKVDFISKPEVETAEPTEPNTSSDS